MKIAGLVVLVLMLMSLSCMVSDSGLVKENCAVYSSPGAKFVCFVFNPF